jgi:hypothetical protein
MIDYKLKYIIRYENISIYILVYVLTINQITRYLSALLYCPKIDIVVKHPYLLINTNTIHVDFLLYLIFIIFNVYLFISNE